MTQDNFQGGALLMDGASHEHILAWLYQCYPSHQPLPLLLNTPYAALKEDGPILVDAPRQSPLHSAWTAGVAELRHAVWLETRLPTEQLFKSLQRRLQIRAPDGRTFWLRMGDARPLFHAWKADALWPPGFWHGVSVIWMQGGHGPLRTWYNEQPEFDLLPASESADALAILSWPLLEALTQDTEPSAEIEL